MFLLESASINVIGGLTGLKVPNRTTVQTTPATSLKIKPTHTLLCSMVSFNTFYLLKVFSYILL